MWTVEEGERGVPAVVLAGGLPGKSPEAAPGLRDHLSQPLERRRARLER